MLQSRRTSEIVITWTIFGGRSLMTSQLYTEEILIPSYKTGTKLSGKMPWQWSFQHFCFLKYILKLQGVYVYSRAQLGAF